MTSNRENSLIAVLFLGGILIIVVSIYLLVNPASLPSFWGLPVAAKFVPTLFIGMIALLSPLLALALALAVMFGGATVLEAVRPLFPISPFWILLGMAMITMVFRNIRKNQELPWGILVTMLIVLGLAGFYELGTGRANIHGIFVPLVAGIILVVSLSMLRKVSHLVLVASMLIAAFIALEIQVLPYLIPSWGSFRGILREQPPSTSTFFQVTSLDWLLGSVALLCLGMASQARGKWRFLLLVLFAVFATSSILTFTRGSFIILGTGLTALLLISNRGQNRRLGWIFFVGLVLFLIAQYSGAWTYNVALRGPDVELEQLRSGEIGRLTLLIAGFKALPNHLLIGRGAVGPEFHSSFLDIWNNYGGITWLLFWGLIFRLFRRSAAIARIASIDTTHSPVSILSVGLYCSFAGALAISLADATFFTLSFAVVFWLMRGLEIAIWRSGLVQLPMQTHRRPLPTGEGPIGNLQLGGVR